MPTAPRAHTGVMLGPKSLGQSNEGRIGRFAFHSTLFALWWSCGLSTAVPWDALCSARHAMEPMRHEFHTQGSFPAATLVAERLEVDLAARGVVCNATRRCKVIAKDAATVEVCLAVSPHMCDPRSEPQQRVGGVAPRCYRFNVPRLVGWARRAKSRHPYAYSTRDAGVLWENKPGRPSNGSRDFETLEALMRASKLYTEHSGTRPAACAFAASGHDLRCARRGAQIDAHERVYRANGGQQFDNPLRTPVAKALHIDAALAGARTSHRINCLFGSKALPSASSEVCVLPMLWWKRAWGTEHSSSQPHLCCAPPIQSKYDLASLVRANASRARLAWFSPTLTGDAVLDKVLAGSGGNALALAISECDSVDVFGVGLFSARIEDPKVYTHFYDDSVRMSCDRGVPKHTTLATDRLQGELIMHLMHALGIITWWQ